MNEVEKLRGLLQALVSEVLEERTSYRLNATTVEAVVNAQAALAEPQGEPALAAVPDSSDAFYSGLYKKSAPMWHRLHDLAVSKGYDHVRFAIECAPVYKCDCMGSRKVAIDTAGNTMPCECVAAANEVEPAPEQSGLVDAPFNPTEEQWSGLARDIVWWMRMYPSSQQTPSTLMEHLSNLGREVPTWMGDEAELRTQDHVISKGTIAVLVYKAMLDALAAKGPSK